MYESSAQTFIFKYIHPALMIFGGLFGIYTMWNDVAPVDSGFFKAFCVAFLWVSIFLIQAPFRLKSIEATPDGVKIKSGNSFELIKYKNIEFISKVDLAAPWFMTLKYKDEATNLTRKIAYIPSKRNQTLFKEDQLTAYIKEKMKSQIPHYDESIHPSTIQNILILFMLATPVMGLMLYFMKDAFF